MTAADPIDVDAAVPRLRTLANPARLRIALRLLQGEVSVATIETSLGLRQPNLSQHLGDLREAGLVTARRESRTVFYSLADAGAQRLVASIAAGFGASAPQRSPHPALDPAFDPVPDTPLGASASGGAAGPVEAAVFAVIEGGDP
ncbi:ArsR/SmtB family transcription factor [Acidisphaera rubrifaciens]|uniref:Transcriptional regulator ArsR n=1 Tax=Acidisphaera rubrifaciens HS-AP3 TaxID=1231350 RepID=A0A0D6P5E2_9PROT|nr:metalloregulator ArsR/SmtB family transcription factor [Acidisphaera rubrifaciens]GAN76985.1 transcriptional regulator ArsR [Acidisphaera rubrifaciens HS-AP3]